MKNIFFILVIFIVITNPGLSQEIQNPKTQLIDRPIESKLNQATWRTDYYICTGIAYAKSLGMTVKDFAVFVGNKHSITGPRDTSISAVIKTFNTVMTTYPNGIMKLRSETNSNATMIWNRSYMSYFKNGPVLGVTLDEFEEYFYGHVAIMTKRIGVLFKYDIKGDTVYGNISRYR